MLDPQVSPEEIKSREVELNSLPYGDFEYPYRVSLFPHLHTPFTPFSLSLISLTIQLYCLCVEKFAFWLVVSVKHSIYFTIKHKISLMVSVDVKHHVYFTENNQFTVNNEQLCGVQAQYMLLFLFFNVSVRCHILR